MKMILKNEQLKANRLTRIAYADNLFLGYEGEIYSYKLALNVNEQTGTITNTLYFLRKLNATDFQVIPTNNGNLTHEIIQRDNVPFYNINGEEVYHFNAERTDVLLDEIGQPVRRLAEYSRNEEAFLPVISPAIDLTVMNYLGNHPKFVVDETQE
jgi:hypothetical protein